MKVLVTGGGGFIGAWVTRRLLAEAADVRILELGEDTALLEGVLGRDAAVVDWMSGDVSRRHDLQTALAGCDRVIHLAGALGPICQTNPARAAEINYVGTLHLFELAAARSMPVVYASTALVHASEAGAPIAPGGHYGVFKLACELSASVFGQSHHVPSIGIRPPVVYGFGRTAGNSAGLSLACRAAARGEDYTIPMSGTVEAIYVEDVASAFLTAALASYEGVHAVNLSGDRISLTDFIDAIRIVVPDARIRCGGEPHGIAPARPGADMGDLFPGLPATPIRDGVAATIAHHRDGVARIAARTG